MYCKTMHVSWVSNFDNRKTLSTFLSEMKYMVVDAGDILDIMAAKSSHVISAAIDFGTTFSGYAFSTLHDFHTSPDKVSSLTWTATSGCLQSLKTSTAVLFTPDKKFSCFGFEAEDKYSELTLGEGGKMVLLLQIQDGALPALDVFSAAIGYMKDHLLQTCNKQGLDLLPHDIQWVLTVPAIWDDSAKLFMRKAAVKAGMLSDKLLLALEPEAAAMYCKHIHVNVSADWDGSKTLSNFRPGTKYMVVDAGGGTVDITVHQVQELGTLREVCAASGGDWGGTMVDKEFERLLRNIFGQRVFRKFQRDHIDDFLEFFRTFEIKKRTLSEKQDTMTFTVPTSLLDMYQSGKMSGDANEFVAARSGQILLKQSKLRVSSQCISSLYESSSSCLVNHLKKMMQDPLAADISSIIMVGGYSECSFLQEKVIQEFPSTRVIVPSEPGLAVLKGAVITGHTPSAMTQRVCRYTYGIRSNSQFIEGVHDEKRKYVNTRGKIKCRDVFKWQVSVGDAIQVGHKGKMLRYGVHDEQSTYMMFSVYISTQQNPLYTDDCKKIGNLRIEMPDTTKGLERGADVQLIFGGSEITVEATDIFTGVKQSANFDFA
ncbi:heat shock 70 kDa protein 12A-like [Argopecten irradians]|uniref:heat shock 70 kDa protein 12A-like n=1 Tax=Argopecten irradians TaxID=31199 RepID=UPI003720E519